MWQLVRGYGGGIRYRFNGRLRSPMLRDKGDGAPHRIIVAERGVFSASSGQTMVIYGEVHHEYRCKPVEASKPPDFRSAERETAACRAANKPVRSGCRPGRGGRPAARPSKPWRNSPFRRARGNSRLKPGALSRADTAFRRRIPRGFADRVVPRAG